MSTPEDFLTFAEGQLSKSTPSQISLRMATGRAYYAVLHLLKKYLVEERGKSFENATGTHAVVRREIIQEANQAGVLAPDFLKSSAGLLKDMQERREMADYDLSSPISNNIAMSQVAQARRIFSQFQNYLNNK